MDKLSLEKLLKDNFEEQFRYHNDFIDEFVNEVTNSGQEEKIINLFIRRLFAIIGLGNIDYGLPWLEHLKKYGNMYSLHIDTAGKNYRVLFSRDKDGKIFLRMFHERSGKKKTSYQSNVKIAQLRYSEYKKEEKK